MKRPWNSAWLLALVVIVLVGLSAPALFGRGDGSPLEISAWQLMANPGPLSRAHAKLESDCSACHTSVAGAADQKCVQCHANSSTILLLQSTAFHGEIGGCHVCHREHRGRNGSLREMDHKILAKLVERRLRSEFVEGDPDASLRQRRVDAWAGVSVRDGAAGRVGSLELALDCNKCHSSKDPHVGYFGTACAACHGTAHWKIPSYVHPSDFSTDCEQCHRPPLSHSSPMFARMCATKLGKSGTPVADCHACHQITSWFDIRGAPWHKKSMGHGYGR